MIDQKIVRNYASCLFSNVKSDLEHQKVLDQISLFNQLLLSSELIRFSLYSPIISKSDKLKLLKVFMERFEFEKLVSQFFIVIIKNSRFEILSSVVEQYKYLLNEARGVKLVTVESIVKEPSEKILNIIKIYLEDKLKKIVEFNTIQNESLIGGVVIKYDSLFYDCSISGILDRTAKIVKLVKI